MTTDADHPGHDAPHEADAPARPRLPALRGAMAEPIDPALLARIVEAALLAASQPMAVAALQAVLGEDEPAPAGAIEAALALLQAACIDRGVELVEVASGWRYQVKAEVHPYVTRMWTDRKTRYTRATLETLALIAYRQPITRGEIEQVRGVAVSTNIIQALEEREWIRVVGHRDVPGKPALFGTTKGFLDYFGLKRLDELPPLSEIRDLGELEPQLPFDAAPIAARLGGAPQGEGAGSSAGTGSDGVADGAGDGAGDAGGDNDGDEVTDADADADHSVSIADTATAPDPREASADASGVLTDTATVPSPSEATAGANGVLTDTAVIERSTGAGTERQQADAVDPADPADPLDPADPADDDGTLAAGALQTAEPDGDPNSSKASSSGDTDSEADPGVETHADAATGRGFQSESETESLSGSDPAHAATDPADTLDTNAPTTARPGARAAAPPIHPTDDAIAPSPSPLNVPEQDNAVETTTVHPDEAASNDGPEHDR